MSWIISKALMDSYENSPSSQGQAAESSQGTYWGGGPSAPSNTSHTPLLYLSSDKMIAFSRLSRSGMTFGLLTDGLGEELLTWFLEVFLAPTSAPQDVAPELQAKRPASGKKWHGSFAKFDPATSSWKIPHCLPLVGSMSFSATWPRWGSMRNGACSELPTPGRRIKGTGSGLWPTPVAQDDGKTVEAHLAMKDRMKGGPRKAITSLTVMVKATERGVWPTPTVHGDYNRKGASKNSGDGLATAVKLFPTPTSTNTKAIHMRGADKGKAREPRTYFPTPTAVTASGGAALCKWGGAGSREKLKQIMPPAEINGALNPDWVEWLMGWPIGWTSLGPLNPEIFREWQREFRIESDGLSVSATARFRRAL